MQSTSGFPILLWLYTYNCIWTGAIDICPIPVLTFISYLICSWALALCPNSWGNNFGIQAFSPQLKPGCSLAKSKKLVSNEKISNIYSFLSPGSSLKGSPSEKSPIRYQNMQCFLKHVTHNFRKISIALIIFDKVKVQSALQSISIKER